MTASYCNCAPFLGNRLTVGYPIMPYAIDPIGLAFSIIAAESRNEPRTSARFENSISPSPFPPHEDGNTTMTRLYLDTEFNGFGGELISLALYCPFPAAAFYEVVAYPRFIDPWVEENVIPKLGQTPIGRDAFKERLRSFLSLHRHPVVVADWPADFAHLFDSIMVEGHWEVDIPLEAHLINSGKFESANPHNALSDAMALAAWHLEATAAA